MRAGACAAAMCAALGASVDDGARFAGIAFVDASVTSQGSLAVLPPGTPIVPPGSTVTGAFECPTNRYGTDRLIVAIIDYRGRPNAAQLAVTRHPASGGTFENAPYYLDLNPGRTLQFLGPIRENGTYDLRLETGLGQAAQDRESMTFTLNRNCAPP